MMKKAIFNILLCLMCISMIAGYLLMDSVIPRSNEIIATQYECIGSVNMNYTNAEINTTFKLGSSEKIYIVDMVYFIAKENNITLIYFGDKGDMASLLSKQAHHFKYINDLSIMDATCDVSHIKPINIKNVYEVNIEGDNIRQVDYSVTNLLDEIAEIDISLKVVDANLSYIRTKIEVQE